MPNLDAVEADTAYEYADDVPINEDEWDAEDELKDA
jgi:hypothetical protein